MRSMAIRCLQFIVKQERRTKTVLTRAAQRLQYILPPISVIFSDTGYRVPTSTPSHPFAHKDLITTMHSGMQIRMKVNVWGVENTEITCYRIERYIISPDME